MKKMLSMLSIMTLATPSYVSLFSLQSCSKTVEWLSPKYESDNVYKQNIVYSVLSDLQQLSYANIYEYLDNPSDAPGTYDTVDDSGFDGYYHTNASDLITKVNTHDKSLSDVQNGTYSFNINFDPSKGDAASNFTNFVKTYSTDETTKVNKYSVDNNSDSTSSDGHHEMFRERIDPITFGDADIYDDDDGNVDIETLQDVYQLWLETRVEIMRENYALLSGEKKDKISPSVFISYFTKKEEYKTSETDDNGFLESSISYDSADNYYYWNSSAFNGSIARVIQSIMDQWAHVSFDESTNTGTIYWGKTKITSDLENVSVEIQQTKFSYNIIEW